MMSTNILVAEDETNLRDFICRNLKARGFRVHEAANGLEALAIFEQNQLSLLILDLMMPRMDGLEVCRRVREKSIVPIIVLSALDAEHDKVAAFGLGADDYLTKPFGVEELLARIHAVLRRAQWSPVSAITPLHIKRFADVEIDIETRIVRKAGAEVKLTRTEYALLLEMLTNANKVLTHRMLLQRVWGNEYSGEAEYLRVYVGRLRRKFEADPANPKHFLTEAGVGYRFVG
ncbi:MAG: response regulator transcription factor [Chloroflexota bacterium]|jgi:two-component system KDP operon response regulator KdpE|nr:response regulator transcription factor [Chloroflexota bacterium]